MPHRLCELGPQHDAAIRMRIEGWRGSRAGSRLLDDRADGFELPQARLPASPLSPRADFLDALDGSVGTKVVPWHSGGSHRESTSFLATSHG